jgi:putative chitinase
MPTPAAPVTAAQLKIVFPAAADADLQTIAGDLNLHPVAFGLDSNLRLAHFFAQVRQEVGPGMTDMSENLNYSPAALAKFGYYQSRAAEARADGYEKDATGRIVRKANKEAIANKAYGARLGNGPVESGDGWRFRGRGCIQVTGRSNYAAITRRCQLLYPGMDVDYVANPDLMAQLPGAIRSAVGFWVENGLQLLADKGATGADVDRITAKVNLHTDSYAGRRDNFGIARRAFP